jgi:hypothetical protein
VDVMPFDPSVLGFGNRFSRLGFDQAEEREVAPGLTIRTLPPGYLFASKVARPTRRAESGIPTTARTSKTSFAYSTGRPRSSTRLSPETTSYANLSRSWATGFLSDPRLTDLVAGHITRGPLLDQRVERVAGRIRRLARPRTG